MTAADPLSPPTGYADGSRVPVTLPSPPFQSDHRLRRAERETRTRDALAVRIIAGLFQGSMRSLAREHGISVQSLSRRVRWLALRLGLRLHLMPEHHCQALAEAQRQRWKRLKENSGAAGNATPGFCETRIGGATVTNGRSCQNRITAAGETFLPRKAST